MPPRIIAVLSRLRQDLATCLAPEAIRQACRDAGYAWRDRFLDPVTTIYLFLLQVLNDILRVTPRGLDSGPVMVAEARPRNEDRAHI